jgi:hypothetical protein
MNLALVLNILCRMDSKVKAGGKAGKNTPALEALEICVKSSADYENFEIFGIIMHPSLKLGILSSRWRYNSSLLLGSS